ncbi:MAG: PTS sugar transporter subunit IIA [Spirochaetales bacterium]|nr:PTS sugar transporter subunit IIA [Spirochaetales bacterium]
MILKKRILPELITPAATFSNKDEILKFIAEKVSKNSAFSDVSEASIYAGLVERETLCSTGMGDGIAIPHYTEENAKDFAVGFISLKTPVDFDSLDNKPARLIFYIVGPKSKRNIHINLLSAISKLLKNTANKKKLEKSETVEDVLAVLSQNGGESESELPVKPKSIFQVVIQKESIFTEILEVLTSGEDNNVTILEGGNASSYLNKLPLFSTYWTEEDDRFNRIIISVVDRYTCNDLIRRIKLIEGYDQEKPGLLITVQEAVYAEGSLDY